MSAQALNAVPIYYLINQWSIVLIDVCHSD